MITTFSSKPESAHLLQSISRPGAGYGQRLSKIARRKATGQRAAATFKPFTQVRLNGSVPKEDRGRASARDDTALKQRRIKQVRFWVGGAALTELAIWNLMAVEGFSGFLWTAPGGKRYKPGQRPYSRVLWVVNGRLFITLTQSGRQFTLNRGDRLEIPPHVTHRVQTGPAGDVVCLEAHCDRQPK